MIIKIFKKIIIINYIYFKQVYFQYLCYIFKQIKNKWKINYFLSNNQVIKQMNKFNFFYNYLFITIYIYF